MKRCYVCLCMLFALGLLVESVRPGACAQERPLAQIDEVYPREIHTAAFTLDRAQTVTIEAIGPDDRDRAYLLGDAWLLDAFTREVRWSFRTADATPSGQGLREAQTRLRLPAGAYEVYYASYPTWVRQKGEWKESQGLGDFVRSVVNQIFNRDEHDDWEDDYRSQARRYRLTVNGVGRAEADADRLAEYFRARAFLSLSGLDDDAHAHQGFTLKRPMEIEVYALGEMYTDEVFDYGWILNVDTRKRVWSMDYRSTDHAGGVDKNRVSNDVIRLPEGRYAAFFVTDDSHSYAGHFNAAPPFDPAFWGITLLTHDPEMQRYVSLFDYENVPLADAVVTLRGLGDDVHESQGFTLRRPLDLRVYALGEGRNGKMYDYGWIVNARTRERVWEMTYANTEAAGGGDKNRLHDRVIALPAGSYMAHFATDDSHNYGDFNTAPPFDPEAWGLTIVPAGTGFDRAAITAFEEGRDEDVLAQLIRIRDDAHPTTRFTLDRDADLRIYALGEGSGNKMYDYGWIEDARGNVVWEMTYRMTEHAGGASKNRMLNRIITLRAGTYTLHYKTDGSHSYEDWNSRAPDDPAYWGITLRRER